jgi:aerobic-type carbon monoxide dehydrogenase small subunit (CoxS/CutS family)
MAVRFTVNGVEREFAGDGDMPLLWYLRDHAQLTGTKFGCGGGFCGACTVLVDRAPMRSCLLPVSTLAGRSVTTIEGVGEGGLHAVQKAWIEEDVPQCGYCQAGQVLSAVALLERTPDPAPADVDTITNLCRCGTYVRIRRAIARAAKDLKERA